MNEQMCACACLHVEYHTLRNLDGTTMGWWQCDLCERKFIPEAVAARLSQDAANSIIGDYDKRIVQLEAELDQFHRHQGFVYILPRWIRKYLPGIEECEERIPQTLAETVIQDALDEHALRDVGFYCQKCGTVYTPGVMACSTCQPEIYEKLAEEVDEKETAQEAGDQAGETTD